LGGKISEYEIIIDIPERISFEIDLPIYDSVKDKVILFKQTNSIFCEQTVKQFTRSLRSVSLICRRDEALIKTLRKLPHVQELKGA